MIEEERRVLFVSGCIFNPNVLPIEKQNFSTSTKELLKFFSEFDIGLIQMPCPQFEFNGGLGRKQKTKTELDREIYRESCKKLSKKLIECIEKYRSKDYKVLGVLGVEFSPNCGVNKIENGFRNVPGKGIFIEEFEREMSEKNFQIPLIGLDLNNVAKTIENLNLLLKNS